MRTAIASGVALALISLVAAPAEAYYESKRYTLGAGDLVCLQTLHARLAGFGCVSFTAPTEDFGFDGTVEVYVDDDVLNPVGAKICSPDPGCASGVAESFCGSTWVSGIAAGAPVYVLIHALYGPADCNPALGIGLKGIVKVSWGTQGNETAPIA